MKRLMCLLVNVLIISECFCQTTGQQKEKIEDYFMPAVKKYQIVHIQQDGSIASTIKTKCEILKTEIKGAHVLRIKSYLIENGESHWVSTTESLFACAPDQVVEIRCKTTTALGSQPILTQEPKILLKLPETGKKNQWTETGKDGTKTTYTVSFKTENGVKMLLMETHVITPTRDWGKSVDFYEKNKGYIKTMVNGRLNKKIIFED